MRYALVLALAGCYHRVDERSCAIRCDLEACPSSLECGPDNLCHELGGSPCTGAAPNDSNAASDAPPDALPGCIRRSTRTTARRALRSDQTVWCWGDNNLGLVGDGTTGNTRSQPTEVNGIIDATAVELGKNAAYARDHVQARSAARA